LDYFGQAPIIVRFQQPPGRQLRECLCRKYRSEFCANQGDPGKRLASFTRAVKLVYASASILMPCCTAVTGDWVKAMNKWPSWYSVCPACPISTTFSLPWQESLFSRNLYAWADRIDPKKGMIRLVFGLGTRAVNRVGETIHG